MEQHESHYLENSGHGVSRDTIKVLCRLRERTSKKDRNVVDFNSGAHQHLAHCSDAIENRRSTAASTGSVTCAALFISRAVRRCRGCILLPLLVAAWLLLPDDADVDERGLAFQGGKPPDLLGRCRSGCLSSRRASNLVNCEKRLLNQSSSSIDLNFQREGTGRLGCRPVSF